MTAPSDLEEKDQGSSSSERAALLPAEASCSAAQSGAGEGDIYGRCIELPEHLAQLPAADLYELLDYANDVQAWALKIKGEPTFGDAAAHFQTTVERIADAVSAHYWMFTLDDGRPLAARRIEHEGE